MLFNQIQNFFSVWTVFPVPPLSLSLLGVGVESFRKVRVNESGVFDHIGNESEWEFLKKFTPTPNQLKIY
jgi:hypothetical protein